MNERTSQMLRNLAVMKEGDTTSVNKFVARKNKKWWNTLSKQQKTKERQSRRFNV